MQKRTRVAYESGEMAETVLHMQNDIQIRRDYVVMGDIYSSTAPNQLRNFMAADVERER